ncbi:LapA family protein [Spirulina major]|uniref:LapA family protein n=1 Tax=Spirulina major TaxID=270636 RepID=UPI00093442A6|nr:LapA family protein [Spirulina major]
MRIGVFLAAVGLLTMVVVQNWSPTLPLVVFGTATIAFPLGLWLAFALGAGLITSILLQGLSYRPIVKAPEPPVAPRYRAGVEEPPPRRSRSRPAKGDWETPLDPEWEREADDWDIESPPERPTTPRRESRQPVTEARRNDTTQRDRPADGIYDANYRVITPPPATPDPEPSSPPPRDPTKNTPDASDGEEWEF